jgi:hypothetical protein
MLSRPQVYSQWLTSHWSHNKYISNGCHLMVPWSHGSMLPGSVQEHGCEMRFSEGSLQRPPPGPAHVSGVEARGCFGCSLIVHRMFTECSLKRKRPLLVCTMLAMPDHDSVPVESRSTEGMLEVHWMLTECSLNVH